MADEKREITQHEALTLFQGKLIEVIGTVNEHSAYHDVNVKLFQQIQTALQLNLEAMKILGERLTALEAAQASKQEVTCQTTE